jgi:hypothetical protein
MLVVFFLEGILQFISHFLLFAHKPFAEQKKNLCCVLLETLPEAIFALLYLNLGVLKKFVFRKGVYNSPFSPG